MGGKLVSIDIGNGRRWVRTGDTWCEVDALRVLTIAEVERAERGEWPATTIGEAFAVADATRDSIAPVLVARDEVLIDVDGTRTVVPRGAAEHTLAIGWKVESAPMVTAQAPVGKLRASRAAFLADERRMICAALAATDGDIADAADRLGETSSYLVSTLDEHGIEWGDGEVDLSDLAIVPPHVPAGLTHEQEMRIEEIALAAAAGVYQAWAPYAARAVTDPPAAVHEAARAAYAAALLALRTDAAATAPAGLSPEQAARYLDATTAKLLALVAAAGHAFHEASIAYSSIPYDDERRNLDGLDVWFYTKAVYHTMVDYMSSWIGRGLTPVEPIGGDEAWRRGDREAYRRAAPLFETLVGGGS